MKGEGKEGDTYVGRYIGRRDKERYERRREGMGVWTDGGSAGGKKGGGRIE